MVRQPTTVSPQGETVAMTYYLPELHEREEPLTVEELGERFNVEPTDDNTELVTDLFVALTIMDGLMGDDPTKPEGMERLVRGIASIDEITGLDTQFTVERDVYEERVTAERIPRE